MSKLIVFVGDTNESVSNSAKNYDAGAFLVDCQNLANVIENSNCPATVYTSLGDLPKDLEKVYQLLNCADKIFYCPPNTWSDQKTINLENVTDSLQGLTEFVLSHFDKVKNNVYNLNLTVYNENCFIKLNNQRVSEKTQLWVAGGSDTIGLGVAPHERFGAHLSESLNYPVTFLAEPGSSIEWQADQILRSDIRENDIVVWALPVEKRFPFWVDTQQKVAHIYINHRAHHKISIPPDIIDKILVDNHCFYQSIIHIHQVVNFCKATKSKLLIIGLTISDTFAQYLHNIPNFINYKNIDSLDNYIDLGTDKRHPGPRQHQAYADFCRSALKKLQYI